MRHKAQMTKWRAAAALLMAVVVLAGLMAVPASAVGLRNGLGVTGVIRPGVKPAGNPTDPGPALGDITRVGFGGRLWYVVGYNNTGIPSDATNNLTLLAADAADYDTPLAFNTSASNAYNGSELMAAMNALESGLSAKELAVITPRTLPAEGGPNTMPTDAQALWPLNPGEAERLADAISGFGGEEWWLRSAATTAAYATYVDDAGAVQDGGKQVTDTTPLLRPAVSLPSDAVLFSSEASGTNSKTAVTAGSSTLQAITPITGPIKLTFVSGDTDELDLAVTDTSTRLARVNADFSIAYTGAKTGPGKSVSALLCNQSGEPLYYLRPVDCSTGNDAGNAVINLPSTIAGGEYILKLFNEEVNGDNLSDFASAPISIPLTVDAQAPGITSTVPAGGATDVLLSTSGVTINFDEPMNDAVIGTVTLNGTTLTNPTWNGNQSITYPVSGLQASTTYAVGYAGFCDLAGIYITAGSWQFTTEADGTAPTVVSTTPAHQTTGVDPAIATVSVTFSEAMDISAGALGSVSLGTGITLSNPNWVNSNTIQYDVSGLTYNTQYYFYIQNFKDAAGNTMQADGTHTFTTMADTVKPVVTATAPAHNDVNVPLSTSSLSVTFSKNMDTSSGAMGDVELAPTGATLSNPQWQSDNRTVVYELGGLAHSTAYTITAAGFKDTSGNIMDEDTGRVFTTAGQGIHQVVLTVNRDGSPYTGHGKTFTLRQGNTDVHIGAGTDGTVTFSNVADGTYHIYDGTSDTGHTVTVSGGNQSATLNYYTVRYAVRDAGSASGSTVSATYGGASVASGAVVLGGKELVITAVGRGATHYTYAWSGTGTNNETTHNLTRSGLSATIDATVTVTGSNTSSSGSASGSTSGSSSGSGSTTGGTSSSSSGSGSGSGLPQTSDPNEPALWIALGILALVLAAGSALLMASPRARNWRKRLTGENKMKRNLLRGIAVVGMCAVALSGTQLFAMDRGYREANREYDDLRMELRPAVLDGAADTEAAEAAPDASEPAANWWEEPWATGEEAAESAGGQSEDGRPRQSLQEEQQLEEDRLEEGKKSDPSLVNADYQGWLVVPGTDIDYPVVRGRDNKKYLGTTFNGSANASGAVFMDAGNTAGFNSRHVMIFGHYMKDGSMFSDLEKYLQQGYTAKNPTITVAVDGKTVNYKIFLAKKVNMYDPVYQLDFKNNAEFGAFADRYGAPQGTQQILTLVTCNQNVKTERIIVMASPV